jgi:regulation of enolase protein 1 (concanavalin A-like superfamily)
VKRVRRARKTRRAKRVRRAREGEEEGEERLWRRGSVLPFFNFPDGFPKLSCVVTNDFSDWSTQPYTSPETRDGIFINLRIHKVGHAFVFEATSSPEKESWAFVRIAQLHEPEMEEKKIELGVFGCCPVKQDGCKVKFSEFSVVSGTAFDHNADGVI